MSGIPISALIDTNSETNPPCRPYKFQLFGREYYKWGNLAYAFPQDDEQGGLWDALHNLIYKKALRQRLHTAELISDSSRLRILDVGSGTGKWTDEMAAEYPHSEITGFDLVPFPVRAPFRRNIHSFSPVSFMDAEWPVPKDSQDLIHLALLCGSVPDWQKLYEIAFQYLKPGTGQLEHVEIDYEPRSAPAPFPIEGQSMKRWFECMSFASSQSGVPFACLDPQTTEHYLEEIGFVDVVRRKIRIPFFARQADLYEWHVAHHYKGSMISDNQTDGNAFSGLSMLRLTELGMSVDEVRNLCAEVRQTVNKRFTTLYNNLYVYTARKPVQLTANLQNGSVSQSLSASGTTFEHGV